MLKFFRKPFGKNEARIYLCDTLRKTKRFSKIELADGVTGNTSDFGSEESRFEPWSANKAFRYSESFFYSGLFCFSVSIAT